MEQGREILHKQMITSFSYFTKMPIYKNPIPKEKRVFINELEELIALKKALIKKGVLSDAEINAERN